MVMITMVSRFQRTGGPAFRYNEKIYLMLLFNENCTPNQITVKRDNETQI
jgi:hypothetical protein